MVFNVLAPSVYSIIQLMGFDKYSAHVLEAIVEMTNTGVSIPLISLKFSGHMWVDFVVYTNRRKSWGNIGAQPTSPFLFISELMTTNYWSDHPPVTNFNESKPEETSLSLLVLYRYNAKSLRKNIVHNCFHLCLLPPLPWIPSPFSRSVFKEILRFKDITRTFYTNA